MPTKTGHKYIVCDVANPSWGKTTTLKAVIDLFDANPHAFTKLSEIIHKDKKGNPKDFWTVFQEIATSKIILIQTAGDQKQSFKDTNEYFVNGHVVDIIICASHLDGPSWKALNVLSKSYGYKCIQFSNFCPQINRKSLFKISAISDVNKVHLAQLIFNFALAL